MEVVEPLAFRYEGEGVRRDENNTRFSRWEYTYGLLLDKAVSEVAEKRLTSGTLLEDYYELIESKIEPAVKIVPSESPYQRTPATGRDTSDGIIYIDKQRDTVIIPEPSNDGFVLIISNNNEIAKNIRNEIESELKRLEKTYVGAGVDELRVYTGTDFTDYVVGNSTLTDVDVTHEDPDDFEEELISALEPMSEAFSNNVKVDFEGHSKAPEYDILFAMGDRNLIYIEAKDYAGKDEEPDVNKVIDKPIKQSSLLPIRKTFVCIKGADEGLLEDYQRETELRRNFHIIDDKTYKEEISELLDEVVSHRFTRAVRELDPVS